MIRQTDAQWIGPKPLVLIFDVNETLLDIESMNPLFKRVFGDERVLREWFGQLVTYSMTLTRSELPQPNVVAPDLPALAAEMIRIW